ncbi:uncharacterized protein Pyn_26030 [Prunus yedoensis var. nudiflora]|uniref:Uncharacterized protein n=1 Tax=Prunus yedoensis var. nudiflora TaxID=2094558 RepID=A0A314U967_PRUYE|nr:uncharacterized protein Pyn_26030 [Prunus yedoensis var. nudiflora]
MVRGSIKLLKDAAGSGLSKTLSEILIKDEIPCLVPTDGKTIEADDTIKPEDAVHEADQGGSH